MGRRKGTISAIMTTTTVDDAEIARFSALADKWWDDQGAFKPLHALNPVRLAFLRNHLCDHFGRKPTDPAPLAGLRLLDIGCGGGLLCEPLARLGAQVTGIDASKRNIAAARLHAEGSGLAIDYRCTAAEELAAGERFDAVLAMEIVEHVADVALFLDVTARLTRPGGALALASLNRTAKSYALAIIGAEYILRWMPRGTHDWNKFVTPAEAARSLRKNHLAVTRLTGVGYNLLRGEWELSDDLAVNYMLFAINQAS